MNIKNCDFSKIKEIEQFFSQRRGLFPRAVNILFGSPEEDEINSLYISKCFPDNWTPNGLENDEY